MAKTHAKPAAQEKKSSPSPSRAPAQTTQEVGPTEEQIARRAYELYLARGGQHGHDEQDWLQAERELKLGRQ
jgi:hypothetical protein